MIDLDQEARSFWQARESGVLRFISETPGEFRWQDLAACVGTDPDAFFPEQGGNSRAAKRICMTCDVREECLQYALDNDEAGVWGGMSEIARKRIRWAAQAAAA
jgi:WhiB family transcriptional regulator, redox-sensing transcriptional regulator